MNELVSGINVFQQAIQPHHQELFSRLAKQQAPKVLWIGCSDSRIDPHLITQSMPGTLFVARNPGNIVPPNEQRSEVGASIEYAVDVLNVEDIVVCGHSGCGAMAGVLAPDTVAALAQVRDLISQAWQPTQGADAPTLDHAVERNVMLQVARVSEFPCVARRLAAKEIAVHGWVYEIGTGEVRAFDGQVFAALSGGEDTAAIAPEPVPRYRI